jgi:hypothetical protein
MSKLEGFFPILTDPYPAPKVYSTTIPKTGSVGVGISDRFVEGVDQDTSFPHHTLITAVSGESPFQGTWVQEGQQLLAVNNKYVVKATQGAKEIRETTGELTFVTATLVDTPYCRHFAINLSDSSPGVNFASACGRSLVQVSLVYKNGPFRGFLNEGDIILAINGTPVSTPEAAEEALRQGQMRDFVTIYLLDIDALRRSLTHQVMAYYAAAKDYLTEAWKNVALVEAEKPQGLSLSHGNYSAKGKPVIQAQGGWISFQISGKVITNGLLFEKDSLRLKDTQQYFHLVSQREWAGLGYENSTLFYKGKYRAMVIPFIHRFNQLLEENLGPLKECVGCAVWHLHTGYAVPLVPAAKYPSNAPIAVASLYTSQPQNNGDSASKPSPADAKEGSSPAAAAAAAPKSTEPNDNKYSAPESSHPPPMDTSQQDDSNSEMEDIDITEDTMKQADSSASSGGNAVSSR